MSNPVSAHPAICLNMIVRNEAHIVREALDSVAPFISSWVIVDTGSDDGTQDVIRDHMARLGIPGVLYERPWRNFGHNRSEALTLAQGHGDYIWVVDGDDILVGRPELSRLNADIYAMHVKESTNVYWRQLLFRNGLPVRYLGVVHEYPVCDEPHVEAYLEGDYHIESRRFGARSQDPQKYTRDAELLLAEVERNPDDARSVFYLAQSYRDAGDFSNARKWYARRIEMGGWEQEVFYAMYRLAEAMANLGMPWPEVQDAFLKAWEFRPTRAEPLYALAFRCRMNQDYRLGYLFAERAAQIPLPEQDLFVQAGVYGWRAIDEQAICASWLGKHTEAFSLCRSMVARPDIPDVERQRIAGNRDYSVRAMLEAASSYPQQLVADLTAGPRDGDVTVTLIAGPDRSAAEQSLNTFLNCCTDITQAGRFLVFDAGLSSEDRALLGERYGFLEFTTANPADQLEQIRSQINTPYWLHLGQGWRFFAPDAYLTRLTTVLKAEPQVVQTGINYADATELIGGCAPEDVVRRAEGAGRYVLTDVVARGPAMFDIARLNRAGGIVDARTEFGRRCATLDEVLCSLAI